MRRAFFNLRLERELDRVRVIHWLHFFIIIAAMVVEIFLHRHSFSVIFEIIGLGFLYHLYYSTVKRLYYTFWTFTGIVFIYQFKGFIDAAFTLSTPLSLMYFFAMMLLFLEVYILSSPIYFPRVSWWEYDFRYRTDLKVKVKHREEEMDGRMTDLRRNAGCVVLFSEHKVGQRILVKTRPPYQELNLTAEIASKREFTPGRGITYGVRFLFAERSEKKSFKLLTKLWNEERKARSFVKHSVSEV